ncbi:MAG: hypothetical protein FWE64_03085 [Alphaproteobacteria bacterium]|nr:hypothetical protein [Alphaproteobacteria bacterium]
MAIFIGGREKTAWTEVIKNVLTGDKLTKNPVAGMVTQYLLDNPKKVRDKERIFAYLPQIVSPEKGRLDIIDHQFDVIDGLDTTGGGIKPNRNLAIICDDGAGELPPDAHKVMANIPFMVDLHLRPGAVVNHNLCEDKCYKATEVNLAQYCGAKIVSMDSETLNFIDMDAAEFKQQYGIQELVVHHGLYSFWFTNWKGAVIAFKYKDGVENEATYESKREIVAGLAAEYALNGYQIYHPKSGSIITDGNIINTVLREYWPDGFESKAIIPRTEAMKIMRPCLAPDKKPGPCMGFPCCSYARKRGR